MNSDQAKQALDIVHSGDAEAALEFLKELIASAAGGDASADSEPPPPAEAAAERPKVVASVQGMANVLARGADHVWHQGLSKPKAADIERGRKAFK